MSNNQQTRRQLVRRHNDLRHEINMVEDFNIPCTNLQGMKDELLRIGNAIAEKQYLSEPTTARRRQACMW